MRSGRCNRAVTNLAAGSDDRCILLHEELPRRRHFSIIRDTREKLSLNYDRDRLQNEMRVRCSGRMTMQAGMGGGSFVALALITFIR